jgi:mono/diheme cytochrome c family protein
MRALGIAISILVATIVSAKSQTDLGDVSQGHEFAQMVCAECHRVEKGQASHKMSAAKAFQDIANNSARTEMSLRAFLRMPHRQMPNLILTDGEADNVIAYILSLR